MLIIGAFSALSLMATLLPQAALAAPFHWITGHFLEARSEKVLRDAPSPLILKHITDHDTWHGFRGVDKIFSLYVAVPPTKSAHHKLTGI